MRAIFYNLIFFLTLEKQKHWCDGSAIGGREGPISSPLLWLLLEHEESFSPKEIQ